MNITPEKLKETADQIIRPGAIPREDKDNFQEYKCRRALQAYVSLVLNLPPNNETCRFYSINSLTINPTTGKKLELDCCNPYLGIALEYGNRGDYPDLKRQQCRDLNIHLMSMNRYNKGDIYAKVLSLMENDKEITKEEVYRRACVLSS